MRYASYVARTFMECKRPPQGSLPAACLYANERPRMPLASIIIITYNINYTLFSTILSTSIGLYFFPGSRTRGDSFIFRNVRSTLRYVDAAQRTPANADTSESTRSFDFCPRYSTTNSYGGFIRSRSVFRRIPTNVRPLPLFYRTRTDRPMQSRSHDYTVGVAKLQRSFLSIYFFEWFLFTNTLPSKNNE